MRFKWNQILVLSFKASMNLGNVPNYPNLSFVGVKW